MKMKLARKWFDLRDLPQMSVTRIHVAAIVALLLLAGVVCADEVESARKSFVAFVWQETPLTTDVTYLLENTHRLLPSREVLKTLAKENYGLISDGLQLQNIQADCFVYLKPDCWKNQGSYRI